MRFEKHNTMQFYCWALQILFIISPCGITQEQLQKLEFRRSDAIYRNLNIEVAWWRTGILQLEALKAKCLVAWFDVNIHAWMKIMCVISESKLINFDDKLLHVSFRGYFHCSRSIFGQGSDVSTSVCSLGGYKYVLMRGIQARCADLTQICFKMQSV